jgi:hypothetical protein
MKEQTWRQWVRIVERDEDSPSSLRKGSLAPLTGQDTRVLDAFVACLKLYACSDEIGQFGALSAIRALLPAMQDSTRWIACELIPFVLEWDDRERLWPRMVPGLKIVHVEDHG